MRTTDAGAREYLEVDTMNKEWTASCRDPAKAEGRDRGEPVLQSLRERATELEPQTVRTLQEWIDTASRVFELEVPGDPPDDVWEMLAITQSFLARERDGIVIADEAAYDADLNQLFTF